MSTFPTLWRPRQVFLICNTSEALLIPRQILSEVLRPIPSHGPGEIALPVDPYESLKAKSELDSLQPYEEVWNPSPEAFALLKETYKAARGEPKTQSVWEEEDDCAYYRTDRGCLLATHFFP